MNRRLGSITTIALLLIHLGIAGTVSAHAADREWTPPPDGVVPDGETAVRIAEAVLSAMGPKAQDQLQRYKPWYPTAVADAWEVRGTLPKDMQGGTFVVVIARKDGRVLGVFHEQ